MKISYNWLKEYLDFNLVPNDVAELLTNTGLEVEGVEEYVSIPGGLEGLVVGEIKEVEKHPNADKLSICKVNLGNGEDQQIICGAPNVDAGQKVVVATVGSTIHPTEGEPFKIKRAKIRGIESLGMICAEDEIGVGTSHDGIIILPSEVEAGTEAHQYYKVEKDWIFEIGLTPNRSDGTSHIGVARDMAAALNVLFNANVSVNRPSIDGFKVANNNNPIEVVIENTEACPRYSGVSISGVTVKESPQWIKDRLKSIGVRPINNIVDITNFVLHEYGQPLHAFDADKITGKKVVVKNLLNKTKFTTLDEVERELSSEDLMICNAESGMCIAGVFGGIESGVTDSTTEIFLESAYFEPIGIRKTSFRHLLRTDAATHFEKGADPEITIEALKRATNLIVELAGGEVSSDIIDVYPTKVTRPNICVEYKHIHRLIGEELPKETIHTILTNLDIEIVKDTEDTLTVNVPLYRHDVTRGADVIEEIIRIHGYNNVPIPNQVKSSLSFTEAVVPYKVENNLADHLAGCGYREIMTNSISQDKYYVDNDSLVRLLNSQTAELNVMRPSMLASGLEVLAYNINRKNGNLRLFEMGKTYGKSGDNYYQNRHLTLYLTGKTSESNWLDSGRKQDFYALKTDVQNTLAKAGLTSFNEVLLENDGELEYGTTYSIEAGVIAKFGKVKPSICKQMDIKQDVFYADIDFDKIISYQKNRKINFKGISKFPPVTRDLSMVLDETLPFSKVEAIANKEGKKILKDVSLFDDFRNDKIGKGKKSYAVRYIFRDEQKTLTDKEIDRIMKRLIFKYEEELNAVIRK